MQICVLFHFPPKTSNFSQHLTFLPHDLALNLSQIPWVDVFGILNFLRFPAIRLSDDGWLAGWWWLNLFMVRRLRKGLCRGCVPTWTWPEPVSKSSLSCLQTSVDVCITTPHTNTLTHGNMEKFFDWWSGLQLCKEALIKILNLKKIQINQISRNFSQFARQLCSLTWIEGVKGFCLGPDSR